MSLANAPSSCARNPRLDVDQLLQQAEAADRTDDDPQKLPQEIARREKRLQKRDAAREPREGSANGPRPQPPQTPPEPDEPINLTDPALLAMAAKLKTDEGQARYRKRACTVEPVFGIIKAVLGFRQFLLRGLQKVAGAWNLVCLAYNLKRLHTLRSAAVGA